MEYPDRLLGHFLIATLGWLLGVVPGIALGWGLAMASRKILLPGRWPRFVATLAPWRTLIACLVLFVMTPVLHFLAMKYLGGPIRLMQLNFEWEVANVAFQVFLCTLAVTAGILRNSQAPVPAVLQVVSWARSLAVLAVVLATNVGFWTIDSGLGAVVALDFALMRIRAAASAILWIAGIALVIDLILGVFEFLVASRMAARPAALAHGSTSASTMPSPPASYPNR